MRSADLVRPDATSNGNEHSPTGSIDPILDAAELVIFKLGVDKVTIDDIARAADISRATLYRRAGGREAIIGATLRRHARPFVQETEAAVASEQNFPARIKAGLIHAIAALPRYPLLARTFAGGLSPYNLRIVQPVYQELVNASFQSVFDKARADNAIPATMGIAEMSEWQMRNFLYLAADGPRERDAIEHYIDLFILPVLQSQRQVGDTARNIDVPGGTGTDQQQRFALEAALARASAEIATLAAMLAHMRTSLSPEKEK